MIELYRTQDRSLCPQDSDVRYASACRDFGSCGFDFIESRQAEAYRTFYKRLTDSLGSTVIDFPAQWDPKLGIHVT